MKTNNETARNLQDVRIILAVLWAAGMLSSLNGDTYRLSAMTKFLGASPDLLSIFSINTRGPHFYEQFDPDIKASRQSLGKPYRRHNLCHDHCVFLGLFSCITTPGL